MAIHGEPDAELQDMLGDIEEVQRAAFKPIKAGAMGSEIYKSAETRQAKSKYHNNIHFLGHGMRLGSRSCPTVARDCHGG